MLKVTAWTSSYILLTGESGFNDTQYDYECNDDGNESCPSQIEFEGDSL